MHLRTAGKLFVAASLTRLPFVRCHRWLAVLIACGCLTLSMLVWTTGLRVQAGETTIDALVGQLADDSYATRLNARRKLLKLAESGSAAADEVDRALRKPVPLRGELEYDLARSELRQRIAHRRVQRLHQSFLDEPNSDSPTPSGWTTFCRFAGDDFDARQVFVSIVNRHPSFGDRLQLPNVDAGRDDQDAVPNRLHRLDSLDWIALLTMECCHRPSVSDRRSLAIVSVLSREGLGPDLEGMSSLSDNLNPDVPRRVFARLIGKYLDTVFVDFQDRVCIGMRYGCERLVDIDCRNVLSDRSQSPANVSVALLAMSAQLTSNDELSHWLDDFQDDRRIATVWRTATPAKRIVRSELRDVVLAIRLARQHSDPRDFGFASLRAHPRLGYQPYSLGFESSEQRDAAHQAFLLGRQSVGSID
ncbi:hypothetical protein [Roseiconus lacunae]|uniref:Secreted protein n=1 Tax=Roseiconus lacunae TaxID=2605694 RepID=A0ABT7PBJ9_9BACT|nr:hypothetical protein [Roseiconus lacunae]MDM4013873.1 hypothetical protein [Roseiconus lacunae]